MFLYFNYDTGQKVDFITNWRAHEKKVVFFDFENINWSAHEDITSRIIYQKTFLILFSF